MCLNDRFGGKDEDKDKNKGCYSNADSYGMLWNK